MRDVLLISHDVRASFHEREAKIKPLAFPEGKVPPSQAADEGPRHSDTNQLPTSSVSHTLDSFPLWEAKTKPLAFPEGKVPPAGGG